MLDANDLSIERIRQDLQLLQSNRVVDNIGALEANQTAQQQQQPLQLIQVVGDIGTFQDTQTAQQQQQPPVLQVIENIAAPGNFQVVDGIETDTQTGQQQQHPPIIEVIDGIGAPANFQATHGAQVQQPIQVVRVDRFDNRGQNIPSDGVQAPFLFVMNESFEDGEFLFKNKLLFNIIFFR